MTPQTPRPAPMAVTRVWRIVILLLKNPITYLSLSALRKTKGAPVFIPVSPRQMVPYSVVPFIPACFFQGRSPDRLCVFHIAAASPLLPVSGCRSVAVCIIASPQRSSSLSEDSSPSTDISGKSPSGASSAEASASSSVPSISITSNTSSRPIFSSQCR